MKYFIDGQLTGAFALNSNPLQPVPTARHYYMRPGEGKKIFFTFEDNDTTDDKSLATTDGDLINNLGTIRVEVSPARFTTLPPGPAPYFNFNKNVFDEKSKKGMIKHAIEGIIKPTTEKTTPRCMASLYGTKFSFIFHYRSRDWLQAEEYIPYERQAPIAEHTVNEGADVVQFTDTQTGLAVETGCKRISREEEEGAQQAIKPEEGEDGLRQAKQRKLEEKAKEVVIDLTGD